MSQSSDANPQYWNQYSPRQYIKHQIVRHYLNGWFPKLGLWAGRILYVDTHAGRGRHRSGQFGSPIVALRTFLEHTSRDKILGKSKVEFKFLERDRNNCEFLGQEISNLGPIPTGIECTVIHANSFDYLLDLCKGLIDAGKNMPPSFLFIDPYSYKVPCEVLRQLKTFRRCELFVNVMWRYLNMVIGNSAKSSSSTNTLNEIFGCSDWRSLLLIDDYEKRAEYAVQILKLS